MSTFSFNFAISTATAMLGKALEDSLTFELPTDIMDLISLEDLSIQYFDGYLFLGVTPVFLPDPHLFKTMLRDKQPKLANALFDYGEDMKHFESFKKPMVYTGKYSFLG